MLIRFFSFLALTLGLLGAPAQAQPARSWQLLNTSNQPLGFEIFDTARGWQSQTIYPNQPASYALAGRDGKFRIATQNRGMVEYRVKAGYSYTLGWNPEKAIWDMKMAAALPAGINPPVNAPPGGMPGVMPAMPVMPASFELTNRGSEQISFETFDAARNSWQMQSAYPKERKVFPLLPGEAVGRIRVPTANHSLATFDVNPGGKYSLRWDGVRNVWDFRPLGRRK